MGDEALVSPRRRPPSEEAIRGRWSTRYRKYRARFRAECVRVDAPCHLCGQSIDYDLPDGQDPDSFEVDHFYPVETHPQLAEDPANFRPSHKSCNGSRGKEPVKPVLGVPSEEW